MAHLLVVVAVVASPVPQAERLDHHLSAGQVVATRADGEGCSGGEDQQCEAGSVCGRFDATSPDAYQCCANWGQSCAWCQAWCQNGAGAPCAHGSNDNCGKDLFCGRYNHEAPDAYQCCKDVEQVGTTSWCQNGPDVISNVAVRLSNDAINRLIPPFAKSFFPGLIKMINELVNENLSPKPVTVGDGCGCSFPTPCGTGAEAEVSVSGVNLQQIQENQITIDAYSEEGNTKLVYLKLTAKNIGANIGLIRAAATACAGLSVTCSINLEAQAGIDAIEVIFKISLEDNSFKFDLYKANVAGVHVTLTPAAVLNVCTGFSLIASLIGDFTTSLASAVVDMLQTTIADLITDQMKDLIGSPTVEIPPIPSIPLMGGDLEIVEELTFLQSPSDNDIVVKAALTFTATYAGLSLATRGGTQSLPLPPRGDLASVAIGSEAISGAIEAVWYVVWASLADSNADRGSPLCADTQSFATKDNPCPYPALTQEETSWLAKTVISMFSGDFFPLRDTKKLWPGGYKIATSIPPPNLTISEMATINGGAPGSLLASGEVKAAVFGLTDCYVKHADDDPAARAKECENGGQEVVIKVGLSFTVPVTLPTYDGKTGKLSDLEVGTPTISEGELLEAYAGAKKTGLVIQQVVSWLSKGATTLLKEVVPKVNEGLGHVLASTSLLIPEVEDVPLEGQTLIMELQNSELEAKESKDHGTQDFLHIASDLAVSVR